MTDQDFDWGSLKLAVTARARLDEGFRSRLLSAPKEAVEMVLGHPLPEHVEIKAIESADDTLYVTVPTQNADP